MNRSLNEYGHLVACVVALALTWTGISAARNYDMIARIESKRKDKLLTLRFDSRPAFESYFILEGERIIGRISVVSSVEQREGVRGGYRATAYYSLDNPADEALIRAGLEIGLRVEAERKTRDYAEPQKKETVVYKSRIISPIDGREMVLVPAGKFVFGSDTGHRDEAPERVVELGDYYIDRHEVSNADYLAFVRKTNGAPPRSWRGGLPEQSEMDLPVMATWMEAEAYARWANKRLPGEMEWEKAARGPAPAAETAKDPDRSGSRLYPWGRGFEPGKSNTLEFWDNPETGKEIKGAYPRGLLPVRSFEGSGDSPYGAVNMAGNAPEWTADWYRAYPESRYADRRFGTRFKVLRGGAWFSGADSVRVTRRQIGGIPNLYKDASGGFRCVKPPALLDVESDGK